MLRPIAISLILVLSVGVMLPFANSGTRSPANCTSRTTTSSSLSFTRLVATLSRALAAEEIGR